MSRETLPSTAQQTLIPLTHPLPLRVLPHASREGERCGRLHSTIAIDQVLDALLLAALGLRVDVGFGDAGGDFF
jgi:hypothetical protein